MTAFRKCADTTPAKLIMMTALPGHHVSSPAGYVSHDDQQVYRRIHVFSMLIQSVSYRRMQDEQLSENSCSSDADVKGTGQQATSMIELVLPVCTDGWRLQPVNDSKVLLAV